MILENLRTFKLGTTEEAVTSLGGLPLFLQMGMGLGLKEKLNKLRVKKRDRGYTPAQMVFSLMGMIQAGGGRIVIQKWRRQSMPLEIRRQRHTA